MGLCEGLADRLEAVDREWEDETEWFVENFSFDATNCSLLARCAGAGDGRCTGEAIK